MLNLYLFLVSLRDVSLQKMKPHELPLKINFFFLFGNADRREKNPLCFMV